VLVLANTHNTYLLPPGKFGLGCHFVYAADDSMTLERSETPPKPSSNVPFRRDTDFVDRESIFSQIEEKCAVIGSWTALVGFGGVG
jgi:hypothetical protein